MPSPASRARRLRTAADHVKSPCYSRGSNSVERSSFIDTERRLATLMYECAELRGEQLSSVRAAAFFGESTSIRALLRAVHDAAAADAPVLITGEVGAGKTS